MRKIRPLVCYSSNRRRQQSLLVVLVACLLGCGTMKSRVATEQLLVSDAIESAIDNFDFKSLAGKSVYLDTRYCQKVTAMGFLNSDYMRSAFRERLMLAECHLKDSFEDADYVIEVRVGALGTDAHEINYGIPGSSAVNTTASLLSGVAAVPSLPEVSLARKDERRSAAMIRLFAYHRESMEPVWLPGNSQGQSVAKATWVLGVGPFEQGSIFDKTHFAGAPINVPEIDTLPVGSSIADFQRRLLRKKTPDPPSEIYPLPPIFVPDTDETIQLVTGEESLLESCPEGASPAVQHEGAASTESPVDSTQQEAQAN